MQACKGGSYRVMPHPSPPLSFLSLVYLGKTEVGGSKFGPCVAELVSKYMLTRAPRTGKLRLKLTFTGENL